MNVACHTLRNSGCCLQHPNTLRNRGHHEPRTSSDAAAPRSPLPCISSLAGDCGEPNASDRPGPAPPLPAAAWPCPSGGHRGRMGVNTSFTLGLYTIVGDARSPSLPPPAPSPCTRLMLLCTLPAPWEGSRPPPRQWEGLAWLLGGEPHVEPAPGESSREVAESAVVRAAVSGDDGRGDVAAGLRRCCCCCGGDGEATVDAVDGWPPSMNSGLGRGLGLESVLGRLARSGLPGDPCRAPEPACCGWRTVAELESSSWTQPDKLLGPLRLLFECWWGAGDVGATPIAGYALLPPLPPLSASANKCGLWTARSSGAAAVSVDGAAPEAHAAACVCAGARGDASDQACSDGDLYRPPPEWYAPPALRLERYGLADAEGTAAVVARRLERDWVKYVSGSTS